MIKWFVDRDNKIPLYLQIKDLIKYYISTGIIKDNQQLPGVVTLSQELRINFDTVRKAYKELEKEKLLSMKRGKGTFATIHKDVIQKIKPEKDIEFELQMEPVAALKRIIIKFLQDGKKLEEIKKVIDQTFSEFSFRYNQFIIFTECNMLQINEISKILKDYLNLSVKPVLLKDLKDELKKISSEKSELLAIVTTGFHMNEVHDIIDDLPIDVCILITSMSPEARRQLDTFDKGARFGFICRDRESISLYKELLKAELGKELKLSCCILEDELKVNAILNSVDVLLVSPPVYENIKKKAAENLPIFNVFDWIEPMSLKTLRNSIFRKLNS